MTVQRRRFLHLAAGAVALPAVSRIANAQGYPSRTVRMVVGFPPGQAIDISARLMAEWLQQRLGQTFIVENRPPPANVATEMVARSPADGYTLLIVSSNNVINTTLYGTIDFTREIAPIATFGRGYQVLNVNNSLPVKTVPDLIGFAKADPGKLSMASRTAGRVARNAGGIHLKRALSLVGGQLEPSERLQPVDFRRLRLEAFPSLGEHSCYRRSGFRGLSLSREKAARRAGRRKLRWRARPRVSKSSHCDRT
jgi:hypothetical protein